MFTKVVTGIVLDKTKVFPVTQEKEIVESPISPIGVDVEVEVEKEKLRVNHNLTLGEEGAVSGYGDWRYVSQRRHGLAEGYRVFA